MTVCQGCGSHVSQGFCRVFAMGDDVHACPKCDEFRRISRGSATGEVVVELTGDRDGENGNQPVATWVPES